jgi:hypothetical protein
MPQKPNARFPTAVPTASNLRFVAMPLTLAHYLSGTGSLVQPAANRPRARKRAGSCRLSGFSQIALLSPGSFVTGTGVTHAAHKIIVTRVPESL